MPQRTRFAKAPRTELAPDTSPVYADPGLELGTAPVLSEGVIIVDPATGLATPLWAGNAAAAGDDGFDLLNGAAGQVLDVDGDLSAQNTVLNPSIDSGLSDWSAKGANTTLAFTTTAGQHYKGAGGAKLTAIGAGGVAMQQPAGVGTAVVAGRVYTLTAWCKSAATSRSVRARIDWYTSGAAFISTSSGTATTSSTSTWLPVLLSATAPGTAAFAILYFDTTASAAAEVQYLDEIAFWDRTAFENLGWSFTGATPYLIREGSVDSIYMVATDISDLWYIQTPSFTPSQIRAYRAGFGVKPYDVTSEPYAGQSGIIFNLADVPEGDGALHSIRTSTGQFTPVDNFTSGGDGVATSVTPTSVVARFGRPNSIVAIAAPGSAFLNDFTLNPSGQVTGHLTPVGAITGLLLGTYAFNSATGSGSTATETSIMPTGAATDLSTIVQYSEPSGFIDTAINHLVQLRLVGDCLQTDTVAQNVQFTMYYSWDNSTFTQLDLTILRCFDAAGGCRRLNYTLSGSLFVPAGATLYINVTQQHSAGAVGTQSVSPALHWMLLPA